MRRTGDRPVPPHRVLEQGSSRTRIALNLWALLISGWLFWVRAALFGLRSGTIAESVLHALGGIGPLMSAAVLTNTEDGVDRGAFWQRLIDVRPLGACRGLPVPAVDCHCCHSHGGLGAKDTGCEVPLL